jgi:23S rRNA (guanine745-N1)-methyltransferase
MIVVCPVRRCGLELHWGERSCTCPAGHSFDIARSGYVNLLLSQDKRAKSPGDSKAMVCARRRLLAAGMGDRLLEGLAAALARIPIRPGARVLDVGCGDGFYLAALAGRFGLEGYGVDISTAAVDAAAQRYPGPRWIAANGDRRLPFADQSFDCVMSITARKNPGEFKRLLAPDGRLLLAVPADDDLAELRQAVLGQATAKDRVGLTTEALEEFFTLESRETARRSVSLDVPALLDLLLVTYRGARFSSADRTAALKPITVTSSAELLCFKERALIPPI